MRARVAPGRLTGSVAAIPAKAEAHRLLICAALAETPTTVVCPSVSEDIEATVRCLRALCADIERTKEGYRVSPRAPSATATLDCGESGSTYRFLLPVAAALGVAARFRLAGRLAQRPMAELISALERGGVRVSGQGSGFVSISGRLTGGEVSLPGDVSSQFITGMLLAGPLMPEGCRIILSTPLQSAGYVDITRWAQRQFSVVSEDLTVSSGQAYRSPGSVRVGGDWSNAAFWLCAAALGAELSVSGLDIGSPQGDRVMLDHLRAFGAEVEVTEAGIRVQPPRAGLRAATIDIDGCPDLAPPLALLATQAQGESVLSPIRRLRLKESDRAETIRETLTALGAHVRIDGDQLRITGGGALAGGVVDGHQDHRIVMMAALAALVSTGPVTVLGAQAVNKSYPDFFDHLAALGAVVTTRDD